MRRSSAEQYGMTKIRTLQAGNGLRKLSISARVPVLPSDRERDHAERKALYASPEWRKARREFLHHNPTCSSPGCRERAVVVDHHDGHQRRDWRVRFWDRSRWMPLCVPCHNAKCGRELGAWEAAGDAI
jgi:hypothetical protein